MTGDNLLRNQRYVEKAANAFYRRFKTPTMSFDDVLQDALLITLTHCRDDASPSCVCTLAFYRLLDKYRHDTMYNRRTRQRNLNYVDMTDPIYEPIFEELPGLDEEYALAINSAYERMAPEHRAIVEDVFERGLDVDETAAQRGISKATVYQRLREFKALAKKCKEESRKKYEV